MTRPDDVREIDLHGLTEAVARQRLLSALAALRSSSPGCRVRVITGAGHHSAGAPVLVAMVRRALESRLPDVASWEYGSDGGSFMVCLAGTARNGTKPPVREDDRTWSNRRQLEYAGRQLARQQSAARDDAAEEERLEQLRREFGRNDLPEWLTSPPAELVRRREQRAREEEADRVEYGLTRAEYEARRRR